MIVAIGYSVVLTACTNGTSSLNVPSPLFAYVADFSNNLWQCPMNTLGQFSGGCTALKNSTTPFNTTTSTSFATFGGVNYAYVNDSTSNLWQCPLNANGGFNGGCFALTNGTVPFNKVLVATFYQVQF